MKTIVNLILDKSGSMSSVQDATISGVNEYVNTLKKDKKSEYEFTLTLFDTRVEKGETTDIKKVVDLDRKSYAPGGMTALYDAVCITVKAVKAKKTQKVLCVIMTDGEENSSREYTEKHMADLIKDKQTNGNWTFVYLGANQDSYAKAQKYGIGASSVANFNTTTRGMNAVMASVANNTMSYSADTSIAGGGGGASFFTKADQDDIESTK